MKRRYLNPFYPGFRHSWFGLTNFHHVLNLFDAYRWEREHPRSVVQTERWLAKRGAAE